MTKTTTTAALLGDLAKHTKAELVQRDAEIDAMVLALVSRHHLLILGEPGTAKTLGSERLLLRIDGCRTFVIPLGPFSAPEHMFGNISIAGLKADRQLYVTKGKLPEAHVAVFDEWTRAGNAILQECLRAWNERTFEQDGEQVQMPLSTGLFLSNHLIDDKDEQVLAAVYDRIMLRRVTEPVVDAAGLRALDLVDLDPDPPKILTWAQVEEAQATAAGVVVPDEVTDARIEIFGKLTAAGLRPSPRRYRESLRIVRAAAFLDGATTARPEHCEPLVDVFWNKPDQRRTVERIVWEVCSPNMHAVSKLIDGIASVQAEVDAAIGENGPDRESACSAARRKLKQHASEVRRLQGASDKSDQALVDVWRRLQGLHDRIMVEALDLPPITLEQALEV